MAIESACEPNHIYAIRILKPILAGCLLAVRRRLKLQAQARVQEAFVATRCRYQPGGNYSRRPTRAKPPPTSRGYRMAQVVDIGEHGELPFPR